MLKIGNPQYHKSLNQVSKTKKPDILMSTSPIVKNETVLPIAYYIPSFGHQPNKTLQGELIAKSINEKIKSTVGAIGTTEFQKELKKIEPKNVVHTIRAYEKISPKKSLISSILKETGSLKESRENAALTIFDALSQRGQAKDLHTQHYKENFEKELNKELYETCLSVKTKKLDYIVTGLIQAIDNKSSLSKEEKIAIKNANSKDLQDYTTKTLETTLHCAKSSFQTQLNTDGLFAKTAESISKLWDSPNRKELVQSDIDTYQQHIKTLESSKTEEDFKNNFKKVFDVEYDPELIISYKNKENNLKASIIAVGIENKYKDSMNDLLSKKPLERTIKVYSTSYHPHIETVETKEQVYKRNYETFAEFIGKGDTEAGKKQIETKFKEYKIKPKASLEKKYETLQKLAKKQATRIHNETQFITKGKDLKKIKNEFHASYNATFGVNNDIAKRVTDYNISQQVGAYAFEALTLGPIMVGIGFATAGTGLIPTMQGFAIATATNFVTHSADRLTSKNGMSEEDLKKVLKFSVLDGATFIGSTLANIGIKFLTSSAFKISKSAAKVTALTLQTAAETSMDAGLEKYLKSKIQIDGVEYSATFSLAGQLLELKLLK